MKRKKTSRVRKSSTKNWGVKGPSIAIPSTVLVPSGKCPFIIEEFDEQQILDWVVALTEWKNSATTYDRGVYTYWLRHSFDVNSQEYKDAKKIVAEVVPDRVKNISDLNLDIVEG